MGNKIVILDSTLRDGAQGVGISFSVEDKLHIAELLDAVGIQYIEAGNPASNPKELEFFERLKSIKLRQAKITAFGSTRRKNTLPEDDIGLQTLLAVDTPVCTVFGKSWKLHIEKVLETTTEENLSMIYDSCKYLKGKGKEVIYDAEHFFDGYKDNPSYAKKTLEAAISGGADRICLCDTNGGTFPETVKTVVSDIKESFSVPVGVHFHDDCGLATANSITAVLAGASEIQGTFLGFGERCGNANLSEIIANLQLKLNFKCIKKEQMSMLTQTAKSVAALANISLNGSMPYVGKNAFAHKAGMHADGVLKVRKSFEHIKPDLVGNIRRFPTSEISGRTVIIEKIKQMLPGTDISAEKVKKILSNIKELEKAGYQFEEADASFERIVRKIVGFDKPFFKTLYYHIDTNFYNDTEKTTDARAVVKIQVEDKIQLMAAEGNGPVHALDQALRKALEVFYPILAKVKLTDYKVRVLDSKNATASRVRVLITSLVGEHTFTTVGVSEDVVAASWKALEDSVEYLLIKQKYSVG
jgi:2-isopropylmalate synthase/homocitrate synthase family protein